jgi:drug/metabolite transporter (DMT)-like permease
MFLREHGQAFGYAVLSFGLFSLHDVGFRLIGGKSGFVDPMFRLAVVVLCLTVILAKTRPVPVVLKSRYHTRQIVRASLNAFGSLLGYYAMLRLNLSNFYLVGFLLPVFVCFAARVALAEQVAVRVWFSLIIGLVGVAMIIPLEQDKPLAVAMALASVLVGAFNPVFVRSMPDDHPFAFSVYSCCLNIIFTLPLLLWWGDSNWLSSQIWLPMLGIGAVVVAANYFYFRSNQIAPANVSAPAVYTKLLWGVLFGWFFWAEVPSFWFWPGAACILAASMLVVLKRPALPVVPVTKSE